MAITHSGLTKEQAEAAKHIKNSMEIEGHHLSDEFVQKQVAIADQSISDGELERRLARAKEKFSKE